MQLILLGVACALLWGATMPEDKSVKSVFGVLLVAFLVLAAMGVGSPANDNEDSPIEPEQVEPVCELDGYCW